MKICGACKNYWPGKAVCRVTGKPVSYLQSRDCYEEPEPYKAPEECITIITPTPNIMEEINTSQTKVCKRCGRKLPATHFSKCKRNKDGFQQYCKDCQKELVATSRKRKRELAEIQVEEAENAVAKTKDGRANKWDSRHEERKTLADIPDSSLIAELKKRGYTGKIYRRVEVEF